MNPILPSATIGVLGSGQLGRMFALSARQMGYRVHTLSPQYDTPTGQVADVEITAAYDDLDAVREFAKGVDVVTFEFENVPAATTEAAEQFVPVRPSGHVLHITQNRLREKKFLNSVGLPVADFREVRSLEELHQAVEEIGLPAILKTAGWGYDGKGQTKIDSTDELGSAWDSVATHQAVLEAFVPFESEISVIVARSVDGAIEHYDPFHNCHANHILDVSSTPATLDPQAAKSAIEIARSVMGALEVVGVLCVEMFYCGGDKILVNELAPRPHNSGHLTIEAHITSQFEQQLRAVCGLPLGSTEQLRPAAMANLLGDVWAGGEPNWAEVAGMSNVKLHLYGKLDPRPGRKMGHLTALASGPSMAVDQVLRARCQLTRDRASTNRASTI